MHAAACTAYRPCRADLFDAGSRQNPIYRLPGVHTHIVANSCAGVRVGCTLGFRAIVDSISLADNTIHMPCPPAQVLLSGFFGLFGLLNVVGPLALPALRTLGSLPATSPWFSLPSRGVSLPARLPWLSARLCARSPRHSGAPSFALRTAGRHVIISAYAYG